jgi:hypothetical protein
MYMHRGEDFAHFLDIYMRGAYMIYIYEYMRHLY